MMPPKTVATPDEVERQFRQECKEQGKIYVPWDQSRLRKKHKQADQRGYVK